MRRILCDCFCVFFSDEERVLFKVCFADPRWSDGFSEGSDCERSSPRQSLHRSFFERESGSGLKRF